VQATWTEPSLDCSVTPDAQSSTWVGVDGATNSDLFQTGTAASCSGGVQSDAAWFEELPNSASIFTFPVSPGDTITAHIWQASLGEWAFTVIDSTSNYEGYSGTGGVIQPIAYSGPETSAEWIEEDPTNGSTGSLFPFADFQTVNFSGVGADLTVPTIDFATNGLEMVQNGSVLALPSAFSNDGFSVTYQ